MNECFRVWWPAAERVRDIQARRNYDACGVPIRSTRLRINDPRKDSIDRRVKTKVYFPQEERKENNMTIATTTNI